MSTRAYATVTASGRSGEADAGLTISTINADRDGDRVIPEGGRFANFLKNPVLMWSHGYQDIPIGTVTQLDVTAGKDIRAAWRWLRDDPFADRVRNAWDQGIVRGSSIGYRPLASKPNSTGGLDIEDWELLELSLCAIPMNPEAVRTLKGLGLLDARPQEGDVVLRLVLDDDADDDPVLRIDVDELRAALRATLPELMREQIQQIAREQSGRIMARISREIDRRRGRVLDDDPAAVRAKRASLRW
jgi:HK97 family phage prohead protease